MDVGGLLKWLGGIGLEEIFLFMILVVGINALRFIREKCPTFRRYIFDPLHRTWLRFRLRIHGLRIKRAIEANDEAALLSLEQDVLLKVRILKALTPIQDQDKAA